MLGMCPVAKLSFSSHNAQVFKHECIYIIYTNSPWTGYAWLYSVTQICLSKS